MNFWKRRRSLTASRSEPANAEQAISLADAARDSGNWQRAVEFYKKTLSFDDTLGDIWVQLGHAYKETGRLRLAATAYEEALKLDNTDAETHLHAAHANKNTGHRLGALRHFLSAFRYGSPNLAEKEELRFQLQSEVIENGHEYIDPLFEELRETARSGPENDFVLELSRQIDCSNLAGSAPSLHDTASIVVFDLSDLIGFWRNARLPTGIQRVQIEVIDAKLRQGDANNLQLCCFIDGRENWLGISIDRFKKLVALATQSGDTSDPEWVEEIANLRLELAVAKPFEFPMSSTLVNLGTSWWIQNYFLFVRQAKLTRNVTYIPFVHDMIPVITPEHCTRQLTQDFISWAIGVFDHADHFLANSQATRRDLISVANTMGHEVSPDDVAVIPLNCDFRKDANEVLPDTYLSEWDLEADDFVLFVSTIESRKGHIFAFDAWVQLIEELGPEKVPKFVCVGNQGWLNDEVYTRLAQDARLAEHVVMLSRLSDAELALLYRKCRFTVYPSLYEGWGLPVTESLCYGKVPLVSDAASLPEAGDEFAVYVTAGSVDDLFEAARELITDNAYLQTLEEKIANDFSPRNWSDVGDQIVGQIGKFSQEDHQATETQDPLIGAPEAFLNRWHCLKRNESTRVWQGISSGEKYRSNLHWFWPEDRGCRVKKEGGEISFCTESTSDDIRILFKLRGDEHARCEFVISSGNDGTTGFLDRNEVKWVWLGLKASDEGSQHSVLFDSVRQSKREQPTYFIEGFFLHEKNDGEAERKLIDMVTLGRLDVLDAFGDTQVVHRQAEKHRLVEK